MALSNTKHGLLHQLEGLLSRVTSFSGIFKKTWYYRSYTYTIHESSTNLITEVEITTHLISTRRYKENFFFQTRIKQHHTDVHDPDAVFPVSMTIISASTAAFLAIFIKKRCTQISIQTSWYASAEGAPPFWECVLYSARWPGPDSFDNVDISGKHCSSSYRKVVPPFPSFVEEIIQINFSCSFIKFFRIPVFFL